MYNIQEIKLLRGSHENTGRTGQGCFMNVVAYLNGEPQITDQSECVCFVVRPIAIWVNDYCDDAQRQKLLPFILRAMGSRTDDKVELTRRVNLVVKFAEVQRDLVAESAAEYAKSAARSAARSAKFAAKSAESAAKSAEYAKSAARSAEYAAKFAAKSAESAARPAAKERIINAAFEFLDAVLPKNTDIDSSVIMLAEELVKLNAKETV